MHECMALMSLLFTYEMMEGLIFAFMVTVTGLSIVCGLAYVMQRYVAVHHLVEVACGLGLGSLLFWTYA